MVSKWVIFTTTNSVFGRSKEHVRLCTVFINATCRGKSLCTSGILLGDPALCLLYKFALFLKIYMITVYLNEMIKAGRNLLLLIMEASVGGSRIYDPSNRGGFIIVPRARSYM